VPTYPIELDRGIFEIAVSDYVEKKMDKIDFIRNYVVRSLENEVKGKIVRILSAHFHQDPMMRQNIYRIEVDYIHEERYGDHLGSVFSQLLENGSYRNPEYDELRFEQQYFVDFLPTTPVLKPSKEKVKKEITYTKIDLDDFKFMEVE